MVICVARGISGVFPTIFEQNSRPHGPFYKVQGHFRTPSLEPPNLNLNRTFSGKCKTIRPFYTVQGLALFGAKPSELVRVRFSGFVNVPPKNEVVSVVIFHKSFISTAYHPLPEIFLNFGSTRRVQPCSCG